MENSAERTSGHGLSEDNYPEPQVVGDKAEESVTVDSDKMLDNEEEVFVEAVEAPEQLMKQEENSESGVGVEAVDDSISAFVDENSEVENDLEAFEEAMDAIPAAAENSEEKIAVDGASVDKVDEGGTGKQVINSELSGGKEESEISSNGVTEVLRAESDHEIEPFALFLPPLNVAKEVSVIGGSPGTDVLKVEVNPNPISENEPSFGEKEVPEVVLNGGTGVLKSMLEVIPSLRFLPDLNREKEVPEIVPDGGNDILEAEVEVNTRHESEPSSEFLSEANGVKEISGVDHVGGTEVLKVEGKVNPGHESEPSFGHKIDAESPVTENIGEPEHEPVVLDYANGVHDNEHSKDNSASVDSEHCNDTNGDVKVTTVDSGFDGEQSSVFQTDKLTSGSETSNSHVERPLNESSGEIQRHEADLPAVDNKESDPTCPDEKVISVDKDSIVIEEHEKKVETDRQEKQNTEVKAEQKTSSPVKLVPSPEKSTDSAPPPARPAGLGRAAPLLEPAPRTVQQQRVNGAMSNVQSQQIEDPANGETEEFDETREKLQMIRVKFLRLAHRLGQTPHNVVVAQVLYRLGLAEQLRGRNGGRVGAFSFDRASAMAVQLEAAGQEALDFSCTIMVLGKTGVGKSATINSIFDEVKFGTDAFQLGTKKVQDVVGTVQGIKVRVIDTPGLLPSGSDQRQNEKILHSVKRFIKNTPPDIVLYLDRLDMQSRDFGDMPLLRTITEIFGPSIWFNAIVVLTHAASAPPDGPNGTASSYDMFVTQRSHVVQQAIRQAAGDMRLMNPVSLVENHSACRTNRAGQRVLPNGQVWKPHLLLLSFASKILAEANALLKLQDTPPGKPFAPRSRAPPLPFLLSSLLQSRPQVKLPEEQYGDDDSLGDDLEESSDSEDESEYDDLPPFRSLTKAQLAKLTKAQKKAYFDELEYREKLLMKKQLKEEKRRRKMMKKMAAEAKELPADHNETAEEESGGASSVPVPMPDLALPASFDSDNPTHRYRYLDTSNQWLVRPVLETHGWDHDVGYEGINVERLFVVKDKVPLSFSGQVTKDKKDANVQMEVASSLKHGQGKSTSLGFDMQTVGKDLAYTLRSETKFCNFRKNKASAGLSVTLLGGALSAGLKVEDKLVATKRFQMVVSGGAMTARGDVAYGGSLEAQLRDADYPLGRSLSTLGLSVMDWHGDLALGCNVQSQIPIGRSTNLIARGNLNNRGAGQISIRINSSEQLQIALIGLLPLLKKAIAYYEQLQLGQ